MSDDHNRERSDEELDIEIVEVRETPAVPRERPAAGVRPFGAPRPGDLEVYVHEPVLRALFDHLRSDTSQELGGLLVGARCVDGSQEWIDVSDHVPAEHTEAGGAHLKFTIATWAAMDRVLDERYPDGGRVGLGWYHSHPNLGVFVSGADETVHRQFSSAWQVAAVMDPVRGDVAFFRRVDGRLQRLHGVHLYGATEGAQALPLVYDGPSRHREESVESMPGGRGGLTHRSEGPTLTIDVPRPSRGAGGPGGKVWGILAIVAAGALALLAYAFLRKPPPAVDTTRADRLSAWVSTLFSAKAIERLHQEKWLAGVKDAKNDGKALASVESEVRTLVEATIGDADSCLKSWEATFQAVAPAARAAPQKQAWEDALDRVRRQVPRVGSEAAVDTPLLGDTLTNRVAMLERAGAMTRVRIEEPAPGPWFGRNGLTLQGQIEGGEGRAKATVNGVEAKLFPGQRFRSTIPPPGTDGPMPVHVRVKLDDEEVATWTGTYRFDSTKPRILVDPVPSESIIEPTRVVTGQVDDIDLEGTTLECTTTGDGAPRTERVPLDPKGFRVPVEFSTDGTRTLTFSARDSAGNVGDAASIRVTYRPRWRDPLERAASLSRTDMRAAVAAYDEANRLDVPEREIDAKSGLREAIAAWKAPARLQVDAPADGAALEGVEVVVRGGVQSGRPTDAVYVNGTVVPTVQGRFEHRLARNGSPGYLIDVEVKDGEEPRCAPVRRTVTFLDPAPSQRVTEVAPTPDVTSPADAIARSYGVPVLFTTAHGLSFRFLEARVVEKNKPPKLVYLQVTELTRQQYASIAPNLALVGEGSGETPVTHVAVADIEAIVARLMPKEGYARPWITYRLPTDEEWSKAAALPLEAAEWGTDVGRARAMKANLLDAPPPPAPAPTPPTGSTGTGGGPGASQPPPGPGSPSGGATGSGRGTAAPPVAPAWPAGGAGAQPLAPAAAAPKSNAFPNPDGHKKAAPVGAYPPNTWGYRDLLGNVWEWTGTGVGASPTQRRIRGGSWKSGLDVADRGFSDLRAVGAKEEDLGFRLVAEMDLATLKQRLDASTASGGR
jgi:proteasome lid subunit RPN8/RPN11